MPGSLPLAHDPLQERGGRVEKGGEVKEASPPQFQQLATWLQAELQAFTHTLRHRQDRQSVAVAVARLRHALHMAEAAVQYPRQRYQLSLEEQWGFVSVFAWVQEVKQELKRYPAPNGEHQ